MKWLLIVTLQTTMPPPPLPEPLHCCTVVTACVSVVTVVAQVSVLIGPVAPTQRVIVRVEGCVLASAPPAVM